MNRYVRRSLRKRALHMQGQMIFVFIPFRFDEDREIVLIDNRDKELIEDLKSAMINLIVAFRFGRDPTPFYDDCVLRWFDVVDDWNNRAIEEGRDLNVIQVSFGGILSKKFGVMTEKAVGLCPMGAHWLAVRADHGLLMLQGEPVTLDNGRVMAVAGSVFAPKNNPDQEES